jgi:hypothetical protein
MAILKELWTKDTVDPNIKTTYEYVLDLRQRLEETCKWEHDQLRKSATKYKGYYDRKAKPRKMKVGDKVLILLPTKSNKLLMQWKGPFVVKEVVEGMDYRLDVHGRTRTFHANMLKLFVKRPEVVATIAAVEDWDWDGEDTEAAARRFRKFPHLIQGAVVP